MRLSKDRITNVTLQDMIKNDSSIKSDVKFYKKNHEWHGEIINRDVYNSAINKLLMSFKTSLKDRLYSVLPEPDATSEIHLHWNIIKIVAKCFHDSDLLKRAELIYRTYSKHFDKSIKMNDAQPAQLTSDNYQHLFNILMHNFKSALVGKTFDYKNTISNSSFFALIYVLGMFNDNQGYLYTYGLLSMAKRAGDQ